MSWLKAKRWRRFCGNNALRYQARQRLEGLPEARMIWSGRLWAVGRSGMRREYGE